MSSTAYDDRTDASTSDFATTFTGEPITVKLLYSQLVSFSSATHSSIKITLVAGGK